MAPVEFHRYIDGRGDTIIYKFDPEVARSPDPKWPNDTPVTVYQHYVITKRNGIENHHSDLLPLELAIARVRTDKPASQPLVGKVMHTENIITDDGAKAKIQYVWKGWGHGEGYRRGWAKLGDRRSEPAVPAQQVIPAVPHFRGRVNDKIMKGVLSQAVKIVPVEKLLKKDSLEPEVEYNVLVKTGDGPATTLEQAQGGVEGHIRFDLYMRQTEDRLTVTQSRSHLISSKSSSTSIKPTANIESQSFTLHDVEVRPEELFADMPELLRGVKEKGGLQRFRKTLSAPQAMQIFDAFLTGITGQKHDSTIDGRYRRKRTRGKQWNFWVIEYKDQLQALDPLM